MAESTRGGARAAAAFVAVTAAAAASPALPLPLLSDDWMNVDAVGEGVPWRTPFGYVRPVHLALFRGGRLLWGLTPWPYHLVSVVLFAACALLMFTLVRKLSGDRDLALGAGVVFALQPFSIEATAWVSSQADLLACLFVLATLLAWVSWRRSAHPAALASSMVFFVVALLSKESAVVAPALIFLVELCLLLGTSRLRSAMVAIAAMAAVATVHILVLRPHVLDVGGTGLPKVTVKHMIGNAIRYIVSSALPLPAEAVEMHPGASALIAGLFLVLLILAVWHGAGRIPPVAGFALAAAMLAGVPALFALQERYYLLPSAGIAVAMVSMIRACSRNVRYVFIATMTVIWCTSIVSQWAEWYAAGRASESLVSGLTRHAVDPSVREIVIANQPHRVRGAPVVIDMSTVIELVTQRRVPVALAARVDYLASDEDGLDAHDGPAVARDGDDVVVRLGIHPAVYRRFVRPVVEIGGTVPTAGDGTLSQLDAERYVVRIPLRSSEGRLVMVWSAGRLVPVTALLR